MRIAIVGPSPIPYCRGGIENFLTGLQRAINESTHHVAELIKIPVRENSVAQLLTSYLKCRMINLDHFDLIISFKYPTWMIRHRNHLVYLGHRLRGLYDSYPIPPEKDRLFSSNPLDFPGPWIQRIIRWLDNQALSPNNISYAFSMSHTIAARKCYFHSDLPPEIICGSTFREEFKCEKGEFFLTVNRLDAPKRVDLMIRAFKQVKTDRRFVVVGSGPQENYLRAIGSSDERIVFEGDVPESRLIDLYARSYAVIYVPYQEDYGLVTIEAMKSGKPVVTVADSGGPLEFIENGINGLIADPSVDSLATALQTLSDNPKLVCTMGISALERMRSITWKNAVTALLRPYEYWPERCVKSRKQRRRITAFIPYPVHPVKSGGQRRESALYRELSRFYDVYLVTMGRDGDSGRNTELSPSFHEICIPPSPAQLREQWILEKQTETAISDVALPRLLHKNPNFIRAIEYFCESTDVVVSCHPYIHSYIKRSKRNRLLIHESQNFEWIMKSHYLANSKSGQSLLRDVYRSEKDAFCFSDLVFTTSSSEAERMEAEYGTPRGILGIVPNGVDVDLFDPVTDQKRMETRTRLGWTKSNIVIFMGAWHPPNLEALLFIINSLAPSLESFHFMIIGSVKDQYEASLGPLPQFENVTYTGVLEEAQLFDYLSGADLAINPMFSGAGTNLKILEYFACGIPVVSTPHGVRGLDVSSGTEVIVAEKESFADALRALADSPITQRSIRDAARRTVIEKYSWKQIAAGMIHTIEQNIVPAGPPELNLAQDEEFSMGWYHAEHWQISGTPHPICVRWSYPECCVFIADQRYDSILEITVQGSPSGSSLRILIDSIPVFSEPISSDFSRVCIPVKTQPGLDWHLITLQSTPWSPKQFGSADDRMLGVAVSRIALHLEQN